MKQTLALVQHDTRRLISLMESEKVLERMIKLEMRATEFDKVKGELDSLKNKMILGFLSGGFTLVVIVITVIVNKLKM
jgi:hypothetical protein